MHFIYHNTERGNLHEKKKQQSNSRIREHSYL